MTSSVNHWVQVGAFLLGILLLPAIAQAQDYQIVSPSWVDPVDGPPRPRLAEIAVPESAGILQLSRVGEFSADTGTDNYAQYGSESGDTVGTIYIYRTGLSDPGIVALATLQIIEGLYGEPVQTRNETTQLDDIPDAARMTVYENASVRGATASTAAGFARAGLWMIKVRVTGPQSRRDDIVGAAYALLRGIELPEGIPIQPTSIYDPAPCPTIVTPPAALVPGSGLEGALVSSTLVAGRSDSDIEDDGNLFLRRPLENPCIVDGDVNEDGIWLVLGDAARNGEPQIVLFGDSGHGMEVLPRIDELESRPFIALYRGDQAWIFGPFDGVPNIEQMRSLGGEGSMEWAGSPVAEVAVGSEGNSEIRIFSDTPD
ncbi:hypothetical protein [uncultured Parasphingopyxis sp.]|uniref:hypothetical protein n=2 Tax=Parasphingopyxis TaxID=1234545 RepID=UPI00263407A8|nr:hypothetical protein [uncultured Parasphingopyxis sp.]